NAQELLSTNEVHVSQDPIEWSTARKVAILSLVIFANFNESLGSSIITPAVPQIVHEFHGTNPSIASFLISIHVIGFAIGPLILSPLGEVYGRSPLMHGSNILFVISSILSAVSPNMGLLLFSRVLTGLAACVPNILGAGYVADLIPVEKRGRIFALLSFGTLLGSTLGPVIGGYLTLSAGWRWLFWTETIVSGTTAFAAIFALKETFAPVIRSRAASKESMNQPDAKTTVREAIVRIIKFMIRSPIIVLATIQISISYVYFYFLTTSFPIVFGDQYGFNAGQLGLVFIGPAVGTCVGLIISGPFSDWYLNLQRKQSGRSIPEDRLITSFAGNIVIAAGFFWYGWSAQFHLHWMMPLAGASISSVGCAVAFIAIQTYLTDSFGIYAPSAIAVNTVVRSILAAVLPLITPSLYHRLGFGWGNSLLGCVALAFSPTTLILSRYGARLRTNPKFQVI
ncbi:major facilitator superfamily domain-containing protein, partial [Penicillium angulare]